MENQGETTTEAPGSRSWRAAAWVLLAVCAVLPGIGALDAPFYLYDDAAWTGQNPFATGQLPPWSAFWKPYLGMYAPCYQLLLYAQWQLHPGSGNPLIFRLVSLALHVGVAWACWRMVYALTRRDGLALGVALLWAAHPAHSEVVAWIVEQKTLGCALFMFLAFAAYAGGDRQPISKQPEIGVSPRLLPALALMLVALLFKGHAVSLAPLLALQELLLPRDAQTPWPRRLLRTLPFFALALAFSIIALLSLEHGVTPVPWGLRDCLLNLPATLALYLKVSLLPWQASFFYDMDRVRSFGSLAFAGNLLCLCALAAGGFFCMARAARRLFLFGVLGWIVAIGPMLNVSIASFPAHDRYLYLALPLLLLAVALVAENLLSAVMKISWIPLLTLSAPAFLRVLCGEKSRLTMRLASVNAGLWLGALVFVAVLGAQRGALFSNELAVMMDAETQAPRAALAHIGVCQCRKAAWSQAVSLLQAGQPLPEGILPQLAHEAYEALNRARDCPDYKDFYHNDIHLLLDVSDMLRLSGLFDEAAVLLNSVLTERRWSVFPAEVEKARRMLEDVEAQRRR